MKKIYDFSLAMLLIGFCTVGSMAQIACLDSVTVIVSDVSGEANISPASIVVGEMPEGTTLDRSLFTCEDIGKDLTVTATAGGEICFSLVTIIDRTPPVAIVDINVEIVIPPGLSELVINPVILDDGSYDNCGAISLQAEPAKVTCADVNQVIEVILYVTDESGNVNAAISEVLVKGSTAGGLNCLRDFELAIVDNYQVKPEFILNGSETCSEISFLVNDSEGLEVENGLLDITHVGQTVTATITQVADNSTCTTVITVVELECDPFFICDTSCNSSPADDCDSGHTNQDYAEWPCDITINASYPGFDGSDPGLLIANFSIAEKDARPQIVESECHEVGMSYEDQVFYIENSVKVVRVWYVLEWRTQYLAEYSQTIVFTSGGSDLVWNICDTNANDAELGDCGSGHSSQDDIEWPADVSALDHRVTPNELMKVAKVSEENARPILVANEEFYRVSYEDGVLSSTANYSLVGRVWTIQSTQSAELSAQYRQNITIPVIDDAADKVFVTTHGGRPMPGVSVNSLTTTNSQGTAILEGNAPVELSYSDDPLAGLDVLDEVLMYKFILGQIAFDDLPYPAMDINLDGYVSTLDIVLLRKLNLEERSPDDFELGWSFYQRTEPFTNVKGDYVSFKVGDVDDSAPLVDLDAADPAEKIVLEDRLLNAGEVYTVEIALTESHDMFAAQVFFALDLEAVEVEDVFVGAFKDNFNWQLKDDGLLSLYVRDEENKTLSIEEGLFTIRLKALKNSTLNEAMGFSKSAESFLVNKLLSKVGVGYEVQGQITSGFHDLPEVKELKVSPNPVSDFVSIEIESERDVYIEISNAQGQRVAISNRTKIDVSSYPTGIYFLRGTNGDVNFKSKFVKL